METCIIGAGPGGLAACKVLHEFDIPFRCFEQAGEVGGTWRFDGTTPCYASLRTNTSKRAMAFSDFALPDDYPDFPTHDQLLAWFKDYVDHFGFRDKIAFQSSVTRVERTPAGTWNVEVNGTPAGEFKAVIVANGNYRKPRLPDYPGTFDGWTIHGHDYNEPEDPVDCRDKRVLVVGLGSTAADIASEVSKVAARLVLSARSGAFIFPRKIRQAALDARLQHPADEPERLFRILPRTLRDALYYRAAEKMIRRVQTIAGAPEDLGLPPPPENPRSKRTTVSDGLLNGIRENRITPKPDVRRLEGDRVRFEDDTTEEIDVIIYATGYHAHFPFLGPEIIPGTHDDIELYHGIMHPEFHDLFIIGLFRPVCAFWPRTEQQVRWIAPILKGNYRMPRSSAIWRNTYPAIKSLATNCTFYTHDLRKDTRRRRIR